MQSNLPTLPRTTALGSRSGFTLIELLVVISIIAVLAGLLVPAITVVRDRVRRTEAQQTVSELASAFEQYANQGNKRYPYPGPFGAVNPYAPASITYYHYTEATDPTRAFAVSYNDTKGGIPIQGVLALLEDLNLPLPASLRYDMSDSDHRLLDPWGNPYHYRLSLTGAIRTAFTCPHKSSTNLTLPSWNWDPPDPTDTSGAPHNCEKARNGRDPSLARPFPYIYSWGRAGSATDSCTWIYQP